MLENVKRDLATLHYDARWLEYGLLDEALLQQQIQHFRTAEDKSPEHYRYAAFRHLLHDRPALSDTELAYYTQLALMDEDGMMADAALADLIGWPGLTPGQFERLDRHPDFQKPRLQRILTRNRLSAELRDGPLTDDLFAQCLAAHDDGIQRALMVRTDLTKRQWETLQAQGHNRAIRNMARMRSKRSEKR